MSMRFFQLATLLAHVALASALESSCVKGDNSCVKLPDEAVDDVPPVMQLLQVGKASKHNSKETTRVEISDNADHKRMGFLSLVTWNLACFEKAKPDEIAKTMLTYGADVICTNEDIEYEEGSVGYPGLEIEGYDRVSTCRAEALWDDQPAYKDGGRFLQNAIYVKRGKAVESLRNFSTALSPPSETYSPRCGAFADLKVGPQLAEPVLLRVAAVHITGGRFVDSNFMTMGGKRGAEVRQAMDALPDVIAGDLNSYPTWANAENALKSYDVFTEATADGLRDQYLAYAVEAVDEFRNGGNERLEHQWFLPPYSPARMETSDYGGIVDHIFVKPGKRQIGLTQSTIPSNFTQSDHRPVRGDFWINA